MQRTNLCIMAIALVGAIIGCVPGPDDPEDDTGMDDDTTPTPDDDVTEPEDDDSTEPGDDDTDPGDDDSSDDDTGTDDDTTPAPGDPVAFTEEASGESGLYESDCYDEECCTELNVEIFSSQEDFDARYASVLPAPDHAIPTSIDFSSQVAILSYTTWCPYQGLRLATNGVWVRKGALTVEVTLWRPYEDYLAVEGRPYNVVSIPSGAYSSASGSLTEDYETAP